MKILIAEDEINIAKGLKYILEKNKYTVDLSYDGGDALDNIGANSYDVIILDIMMPKVNGLEVLKEIRNKGNTTPVLILSAKSEVEDRVNGLDLGADDYLPKPFNSDELLARIRALLRRNDNFKTNEIVYGNTRLNCNTYEVETDNARETLNNKEYQLLELFLSYPKVVFSTEKIMDKIWNQESSGGMDAVWTYIGFIRKKLKNINSNVEIKTVRGVGYLADLINE